MSELVECTGGCGNYIQVGLSPSRICHVCAHRALESMQAENEGFVALVSAQDAELAAFRAQKPLVDEVITALRAWEQSSEETPRHGETVRLLLAAHRLAEHKS